MRLRISVCQSPVLRFCQTAVMPSRPMSESPELLAALDDVVAANEAVRAAAEQWRADLDRRAQAITAARDAGATLVRIGRELDASPDSVRQLEKPGKRR